MKFQGCRALYSYQTYLNQYSLVSLDQLDGVRLLNRKDTKYVFNSLHLPELLDRLKSSYKVLSIQNEKQFNYKNLYFDTDDFIFFKQHHNEERSRYKVRLRNYSPSEDCYFEIKIKNNRNRTVKKRIKRHKVDFKKDHLLESEAELLLRVVGFTPQMISPKLSIEFSRMTLVDNNFTERLTIDTGLKFISGKDYFSLENLAISEIKQEKYNVKSSYIQTLRSLKIPEMRFSKYCMGMINIYKNIKYNRFKEKLLYINRI